MSLHELTARHRNGHRFDSLINEIDFSKCFQRRGAVRRPHRARGPHVVFNIAEIFEIIFSHLSERQLFRLQRVCKKWFAFITHSPVLQRKLWFTACDNMRQLGLVRKTYDPKRCLCWNPLVRWLGFQNLQGDWGKQFLQHQPEFAHIPERTEVKEVMGLQDGFLPWCLGTEAFSSYMLVRTVEIC